MEIELINNTCKAHDLNQNDFFLKHEEVHMVINGKSGRVRAVRLRDANLCVFEPTEVVQPVEQLTPAKFKITSP